MSTTTYSFSDLSVTFRHPSVGQIQLQGEGVGSITFTMSGDVTAHDTAADGSVMVSKILVSNGTIAINVQQTSEANAFFRRYYNYVMAASTAEFATATIICTSPVMKVTHTCTGVSPQKRADAGYEANGKQNTWNFMAARIEEAA